MLEKPAIAEAKIIETLESSYALFVRALAFLPLGNDQRAWTYRVETAAGACFLKLRKGGTKQAALDAPHYLKTLGIEQVVAPLTTTTGALLARVAGYDMILYPFIEGKSAWRMPLTLSQWRAWGEIMRCIHSCSLNAPALAAVEREAFGMKWLPTIDRIEAVLQRRDYRGNVAAEAARVWQKQQEEILRCRDRYRRLGAFLAEDPPVLALCHADIHTANIILDPLGEIRIVDWDETVIAPIERDLMFFVEDGHAPPETEAFFAGYQGGEMNWLALAYYKYDWVVQEFADYGERIFLSDAIGARDLESALVEFKRLFAPGDVINRAHRVFQRMAREPAFAQIGVD